MIEYNTIYNEDCSETLARIPDQVIDIVVTSPPYNMRTRIRNGKYTTREKSEHFSKKYKHFDDALPIDEFYTFHSKVLRELLRVSKIVCYNFQIVTGSKEAFLKIIGDFNKEIKDVAIWDKGKGVPAMHEQVLNSCYEIVLILEGDKKCGRLIQNAKFERGTMDNILRIGRVRETNNIHNAVFPIDLPIKLITAFSNIGDLVYDPFMGSGTTALAAMKCRRKYIGSEISEEYCNLANKKIKDELDQFSLELEEKKQQFTKIFQ